VEAEGVSNRETARRLGVSEAAVCKLLRRLGCASSAPRASRNTRHKGWAVSWACTGRLKSTLDLNVLAAEYGAKAFVNLQSARRTMRAFKIANAPLGRRITDAVAKVAALKRQRAAVPTRVPVQQIREGEVGKLRVERKHFTDLLKMVARTPSSSPNP
jgi:hypothetical protein